MRQEEAWWRGHLLAVRGGREEGMEENGKRGERREGMRENTWRDDGKKRERRGGDRRRTEKRSEGRRRGRDLVTGSCRRVTGKWAGGTL